MPSPIGHSIIGLAIYTSFTPKNRLFKDWKEVAFACLIAISPDFDYFTVLITHNTFDHRTYTHSLLFALLGAVFIYLAQKISLRTGNACFPYYFCLISSHVIADFFVKDGYLPSKIAFYYPLLYMVNSPVSFFGPLNWAKRELLYSMDNVYSLIKECLLTSLLF